MLTDCGGKCASCGNRFALRRIRIDNIKPISEGGHATDPNNLQVLCKKCHFDKTRTEQETGYVKISDTASSFNVKTTEIFNSGLCAVHAFVETLKHEPPGKMKDYQVHYMDINKSRKNNIYFSKHDYPLFTVMDQPRENNPEIGYKRPGN